MNPKTELLKILGIALSRGQGDFTEEELALAFEEVHNLLLQGQLGSLVLEGELNLSIREGTVFYAVAKNEDGPAKPLPREMLIESMRDTEGA